MKKKLTFLFIFILIIGATGCGKKTKMTCTSKQQFGSAELTTEMKLSFKKDYLQSTETIMTVNFPEESTAEAFMKTYEDKTDSNGKALYEVKKDGLTVTVKSKDETSEKIDKNKKDNVVSYLEERGYTCK